MNGQNTSLSGLYSLTILLFGFVLLTCSYNLVYGKRGLVALVEVERELAAIEARLDTLEGEEQTLTARINRLRPGQVDPDFLDEQMVRVLGTRLHGPKHLIVQSEL